MNIEPIAYYRSMQPTKFGVPRQSGLVPELRGKVVFEPRYRNADALRGIDGFDYLWLVWEFSLNGKRKGEWSPLVRPPLLGGNEYVGVFATRSPFRPNALGLSSVRLIGVESGADGPVLIVSGADLVDGTPIYDIKPYLAFSDSHPEAQSGFAETTQDYRLQVNIDDELLAQTLRKGCPWNAIHEILSQDPRPAYQNDSGRIYHLDYGEWKIDFKVENAIVFVIKINKK
jgi:tRNA-Thr(GGU) m(6)t(6)A37 methyltransferase TsaA